jgi:hypothetical protein
LKRFEKGALRMFRKVYIPVLILSLIILSTAYAKELKLKIGVLPAPPNISATVKFSEPSGNNILDAEETGELTISVKNTGKGDAFDVKAEIKTDKKIKDLQFDRVVSFGTIPSGKKITKKIKLKAGEDLPTDRVKFSIDIKEANGFDADPVRIVFKTKAFEPPKLVVADIGIDDQNNNSRVEPLENVEITVRIQNIGHGDARNVRVDVINGRNVFIGGEGKTHFNIGNLSPGEYKDISFIFYTNKRIRNGEKIPLKVEISEQRPQFNTKKNLNLVMNVRQRNIREFVIKGKEYPEADITLAKGLSIDIEQNLPVTRVENKNAFAVVIGNSDYRKAKNVDYAINDAEAVKMYLTEVLGYKEGNVFTITNASKGDFELYFGNAKNYKGKLYNHVKPGKSDVFIYYSGHGAPGLKDRRGYFVPVEADPQYIELSGYSLDVFYKNLSKIPARSITVVIDSCFSGANIFENISPIVPEFENPVINLKNGVVLTSSSGDQVSSWYNEKKHGMFTYFFLKAIHNKNADFNRDNKLTFEEIYQYVSDNAEGVPYYARRIHGVEQTPIIQGHYKGKVFVKY